MTDIADQRADRVIEVTSPLIELRAVQKVYRAGKLEYVAVRRVDLAIVAISMLGLLNAITMSIRERTREIGVLRAIGARAQDVRRIFRTETLSLAVIGFLLATPLGWLIAHALQWLVLNLANISLAAPYSLPVLGLAFIGTLILAALVVAGPLRRATRLRPGDAIRYG